jgi:hypothetical protein
LFASGNIGKTLGNFVTDWGRLRFPLVVIDEVDPGDAQFATVGKLRGQVVPVSFYGVGDGK